MDERKKELKQVLSNLGKVPTAEFGKIMGAYMNKWFPKPTLAEINAANPRSNTDLLSMFDGGLPLPQ